MLARLGGRHSGFRLSNQTSIAYQHDAATLPNGSISIFDNGAVPKVHPQSRGATEDLAAFVRKMRAGADSAITQYFFGFEGYLRFVDDARRAGVHEPIVPGIMPITNFSQLARFSDACGAEIPRWMRRRLESFGDDRASIRAFGLEVVASLCERLLAEGAPGIHFYTMNLAEPTLAIWSRLGLPPASP